MKILLRLVDECDLNDQTQIKRYKIKERLGLFISNQLLNPAKKKNIRIKISLSLIKRLLFEDLFLHIKSKGFYAKCNFPKRAFVKKHPYPLLLGIKNQIHHQNSFLDKISFLERESNV